MLQSTPYTVPYIFSVIISIAYMVFILRKRKVPGGNYFTLLIVFITLWIFGEGLGIMFGSVKLTLFSQYIAWTGKSFSAIFWFLFVLSYTGNSRINERFHIVLLMIVPLVSLCLIWTNGLLGHGLFWKDYHIVYQAGYQLIRYEYGIAYWVSVTYYYILIVYSLFVLVRSLKTQSDVYKNQTLILIISLIIPWIAGIVSDLKIFNFAPLDITPFAFIFSELILIYNIIRYHFLEVIPIARYMVFENLRDLVVVVDNRNRIIDINQSARLYFEKDGIPIIGTNAGETLTFLTHIFDYFDYERGMFEEIELELNGKKRYFDLRISPLTGNRGELLGSIILLYDITERRLAEEYALKERERRRQHEQILIQQSKLAAMGEMLGAIAHQWRQPLNALGLIIQDIEDAFNFDEINKEYIEETVSKAMKQIHFLSGTIDDFRNFFQKDKEKVEFDVKSLIYDVLSLISIQFKSRNIVVLVEFHIDRDSGLFFGRRVFDNVFETTDCRNCMITTSGYPNEFKQVILNIIGNAKEAIIEKCQKEGNPVKGKIHFKIFRNNEEVVIEMIDDGPGIPEDIIQRIFEPYFTTKEQGKGTGIGLYMSKVIIEKNMAGRLIAENLPNGGAKFSIMLTLTGFCKDSDNPEEAKTQCALPNDKRV